MALTPETYALAWVLDRLTVTRITDQEIKNTVAEIKKAIAKEPNSASSYIPNDWDESYPLLMQRNSTE